MISLILTCNLILSKLSNPSNIFYEMPFNSAYGSLMPTDIFFGNLGFICLMSLGLDQYFEIIQFNTSIQLINTSITIFLYDPSSLGKSDLVVLASLCKEKCIIISELHQSIKEYTKESNFLCW